MLVLSRKMGEVVRIGDDVVVTILRVQGSRVQVGIEAPDGMRVLRREIYEPSDPLPPSETAPYAPSETDEVAVAR